MQSGNDFLNKMGAGYELFKNIRRARADRLEHPYKLFYVVTKRCQSRCQNCKIWKEEIQNELSLEEIRKFIAKNPYFSWINLTGGEVTLREDIHEVIETLVRGSPNLYFFNFATNALDPAAVSAVADTIVRLRIPHAVITVSLDGPEKMHDALRGVKGNFRKAVETLQDLRTKKGLQVYPGMTLFEKNIGMIEETYLALRAEIPDLEPGELHLNLPNVSAHYYGNEEKTTTRLGEGMEEGIRAVEEWRKKSERSGMKSFFSPFERVEDAFLKEAKNFLEQQKTPVPCSALKSTVYLSELGEVYPCIIWGKKLGSIRDHDYEIAPILRSALGKATRAEICAGKCPQCWTPCEAYPALLEKKGVLIP